MWILQKEDNLDAVFYLTCGVPLKVGRAQRSTITLLNDSSVSREHASIFIIHEDNNLSCVEKTPEVILQDLSSKYGTFVNDGISSNTKILSNEPKHLKDNDRIRFGSLNNIFILTYQPLVVTSSQLSSQEQLRLDLLCLGGHLVKEWTSKCSLLVMQELKLTAKTVSALATGAYIVTPAYFKDMISAVNSKQSLPNPSLYLPQLKEPSINGSLVSFSPDLIRRTLFHEKTFLFQNRVSLRKMRTVVALSGGNPVELLETNFHKVTESDHILVKTLEKDHAALPSFIMEAFSLLEKKGLVPIPESDIGLAILYKNMEKYCNPNFNVSNILRTAVNYQPQMTQPLHIYATETQFDSEYTYNSNKDTKTNLISCTTIVETGVTTRMTEGITPKTSNIPVSHRNIVTACLDKTLELEQSGCVTSDTFASTNTAELSNWKSEEKENLSNRKRERSPSLDKSALSISKRRSFSFSNANLGKNGVLQESVDLVEKTLNKTVKLDADVFEPLHFSTQNVREKLTADPNSVAVKNISKSNIRNTSLTLNSSMEPEGYFMDNDRVPKSIPFEPYTLPSLEFNGSINDCSQIDNTTQMVIKPEPECSSASKSGRMIDSPDHISGFIKNEVEDNFEKNLKRPRSSSSPERACNDVSNLFAIPFPSARQKRRAKENANASLKLNGYQESNIKDVTKNVAPESTNNSMAIKKEATVLNENCPKVQVQNNNPFISKESHQHIPCVKSDDISNLGEILEKSLMVVEVVSLIRPIAQSNTTLNRTSSGLTNFKRFRKVSNINQNSILLSRNVNTAVPRIIGGCDLITHTSANSRREEFLASQPSENVSSNEGNDDNPTDSGLDPTFLQPFPNLSRRRRVR